MALTLKIGYITTPVATLWTSPDHPREIDLTALTPTVHIPNWLENMSMEERVWLIEQNAVQTQALYGARLHLLEEKGGWTHCLVLDQYTPKNEAGYPGWIPSIQIGFDPTFHQQYDQATSVWVTKRSAKLTTSNTPFSLSYLTRLPLFTQEEEKIAVYLPTGGIGWFNKQDVTSRAEIRASRLLTAGYALPEMGDGKTIVDIGLTFLGVPYLWAGMSSFAYDCSGFAHSLHKACGLLIPRDASAQFQYGKQLGLEVTKAELQPGDLIFFSNEAGRVDHVGIFAGEGQMLHASNSNYAVKVEPLWESKYAGRYCGAVRFWDSQLNDKKRA